MNATDILAVVAIVISSIAFLVALGQILQQYFATAEGYRHCRYSVMGQWSGFTYRKFRCSEFRFETRFSTPHIRIGIRLGRDYRIGNGQIPLLTEAMDVDEKKEKDTEAALRNTTEWVCWVLLIEDIKCVQTQLLNKSPKQAKSMEQSPKELYSDRKITLRNLKFSRSYKPLTAQHQAAKGDEMSVLTLKAQSQGSTTSAVQERNQCSPRGIHELELATCSLRSQSWDLMPPEVMKPLGMIWASDLAVLIFRLGMKWLEFNPNEGVLRAEGNGRVLTSFQVRSVGCCVNLQRYSQPLYSIDALLIPTELVGLMTFGFLPAQYIRLAGSRVPPFPRLHFHANRAALGRLKSVFGVDSLLRVGTFKEILRWVGDDILPKKALDQLQYLHSHDAPLHGFTELIPMTALFLRQEEAEIIRVPAPMEKPYGVLHSETCRLVFVVELEELIRKLQEKPRILPADQGAVETTEPAPEARLGLVQVTEVARRYTGLALDTTWWLNPDDEVAARNSYTLDYLDKVHKQAEYPLKLLAEKQPALIEAVIWTHVKTSISASEDAQKTANAGDKHLHKYDRSKLLKLPRKWQRRYAQAVHLWFERLKRMHEDVNATYDANLDRNYNLGFEEFVAIWTLLMFRAFCWDSCHYMVDGMRVGSEHYDSRMPIYIG